MPFMGGGVKLALFFPVALMLARNGFRSQGGFGSLRMYFSIAFFKWNYKVLATGRIYSWPEKEKIMFKG